MTKKYLVLFYFFFFNSLLIGQNSIYKNFTTEDGLPHDITYQIIQDKNGYIWIGTDDGLAKFDGNTFTNYNYSNGLTSNYVINVIEKGDSLLIATWGGGLHVLYQDRLQKAANFNDSDAKINKIGILKKQKLYVNSLNNNFSIFDFSRPKNNVITNNVILNNNSLQLSKEKKNIVNTNETIINQEIWVHAGENTFTDRKKLLGVYKVKGKKIINAVAVLTDKEVTAITKIKDTIFAMSNSTFYTIHKEKIISTHKLSSKHQKIISIKKHGNKIYYIALNTKNQERKLFSLNLKTKILKCISKILGIHSFISDFIFDKDQNLWITTYGQGVFFVQNTNNQFLGQQQLKNVYIQDIYFSNDTLFLLARNSLQALKNNLSIGSIQTTGYTEHFNRNKNTNKLGIELISFLNNNFIQKKLGKTKINTVSYQTFQSSFENKFVERQLGILKFKTDGHLIKEINFKSEITNIKIFKDKIYVSLFKKGLYIYNYNGVLQAVFDKNNFISTNKINDFFISNQHLSIATDRGVFIIKDNKSQHYSISDGLLSNHINSLFLDKHKILWIGTQKGLNALKDGELYTFDKSNGQNSSFITKIVAHKNKLYISGNKGVFILKNETAYHSKNNSSVNIIQTDKIFDLKPINYINFNSLKTEYKLNNLTWNKIPNGHLDFSNLNQGNYKVTFRYKDNNSNWTIMPTYNFKVSLPWYQQIWFYFLFPILIIILIIYITHKQVSKLRKKNALYLQMVKERDQYQIDINKVRVNIAQDFHDDLGNKLATISILSKLELKKLKSQNLVNRNLVQIQKDADSLYNSMRDFIWTLDSKNNNLLEVLSYLNDFGERLFENQNITFLCSNNLPKTQIILPTYWNKQLILVFKEALTNSLKHSKASFITLNFELTNTHLLKIRLIDNGIGFDSSTLNRVNGLQNMKDRIEKINANISIKSTDLGVTIYFEGNIKNNQN